MSDAPLETLLRPFETGALPWPVGDVLLLRGRSHYALKRLGAHLQVTQPFKPESDRLEQDGFTRIDEVEALRGQWDTILMLPPRARDEMRALFAQASQALSPQGRVIISVANAEGAKSAETDLKALFGTVASDTKNKCRVMWTAPLERCALNDAAVTQWLQLTAVRTQQGTGLQTRPGVFSWQHADNASQLLIQHMPTDLKGKAADLGAGIGLLTVKLLERNAGILHVDAFEAQQQAVELLQLNTQGLKVATHWFDVEQGLRDRYDVIVMTPPFHALSKDGRTDIGIRFINVAANSLKSGGTLLLVANRHLPYEETLKSNFSSLQVLGEGNGFKVIRATK